MMNDDFLKVHGNMSVACNPSQNAVCIAHSGLQMATSIMFKIWCKHAPIAACKASRDSFLSVTSRCSPSSARRLHFYSRYGRATRYSTTSRANENDDSKDTVPGKIDIHEIYLQETDAHTYKLVEWYKGVGDSVEEEDSLCEIETDLFTFDIPAPHGGILAKQVKAAGSILNEEELIATMVNTEDDFEVYKKIANPIDLDLSVEKWLINLCPDSKLDQYAAKFVEEGFDSIEAIKMVDKDDLDDMKIKKGHAKMILKGIAEMNPQEDEG